MILGQDDFANQLVLGKYLILGQLSEGSLGSIYLGRADKGRGDPVFVKSISPLHLKSEEAIKQFQAEVVKLRGIEHPNLAAVLDHGSESGLQLVVSEYIPGYDLGHWLAFAVKKRGQVPVGVAVNIAVQMLGGLAALHESKVVHRDLMPSNVVIDRAGRARVSDFGLSRLVSEGTAVIDPNVTHKLAYLTPELVSKNEPGPPSDVYGTALVLFEMLTGENPFAGDNLGITISSVLMTEPPAASSKRAEVPAALSEIIAKALSKKPEDRHGSASELSEALSPHAAEPSELAQMIAEDYDDPGMLAVKDVVSLAERERQLGTAASIKPVKSTYKPPTRAPTEQRERERISASGEVNIRGAVVWRKSPTTKNPPLEPEKKPKPVAWILAAIAVIAVIALVLVLMLR